MGEFPLLVPIRRKKWQKSVIFIKFLDFCPTENKLYPLDAPPTQMMQPGCSQPVIYISHFTFLSLTPTGGLFVDYFNSNIDPPPFPDKSSIDDSYRGYSVTFGQFDDNSQPDVAVGLPRAPDHKGQVSISPNLPICTNNLGS